MSEQAKHCLNCAYNHDRMCMRSGESITLTRMLSTVEKNWHCDKDYSGWLPAPDMPKREPPKPKRSLRQWLYDTLIA